MSRLRIYLACWLVPLAAAAAAPVDQVQFADGLFSRGLYDLAVREYLAAATNGAAGASDVASYRAAECFRLMGQPERAAELYRQVADQQPAGRYAGRAAFRHAELAVTGGQYAEAVDRFEAVMKAQPAPDLAAPALYYLGYAQHKLDRASKAEKAFERLVREFPDSPYAVWGRVELAGLLMRRDGPDAEIRELLGAALRGGAGQRAGAEALYLLGDQAFRKGDFAASADAYARLLKEYPQDARAGESLLSAAWAHYRAQRPAPALEIVERGLAAAGAPASAEWLYLQANCLRLLERGDDARAVYARLTREYPDSEWGQAGVYETAVLLYQAKDYAGSYDLASRARATPALAEDLAWLRAESAREAGRGVESRRHYEDFARAFPGSARVPTALFQVARLLQAGGETAAAAERYRALAGAYPTDHWAPEALLAGAYCRVVLNQYAEAIADWEQLLASYPDFRARDEAWYGKAQAEVDLKRSAAARASLESMLLQHAKSRLAAEAHYLLGSLLENEGEYEAAEYHYRMATLKKADPALARKIEFRRVAVLQRQGRADEAAQALNGLVAADAGAEIPAPLLDWVVRWNFSRERHDDAERAGRALGESGTNAAWRQIGWYFAGRSAQAGGRLADARASYTRCLEQDAATREGAEAALYLGRAASAEQDWTAAEQAFTQAGERSTTEDLADVRARSYFGLGQAAAARARSEEAARYFMSVAVLYDDPELTPEALYRAAEAFQKLGRAADRDKALAELRQRYPQSTWAAQPAPGA